MRRRARLCALLLFLPLLGCSEPDPYAGKLSSRPTADALVRDFADGNAEGVLGAVAPSEDDPNHDQIGGLPGVALALAAFEPVRFELGAGRTETVDGAKRSVYPLLIERTVPLPADAKKPVVPWAGSRGEPVTVELVWVGRDGTWRVTQDSLKAALHEALSLVEGVSTPERHTWLSIQLLQFELDAVMLSSGQAPSDRQAALRSAAERDAPIEAWPDDAWGRPLHYAPTGKTTFELRSAGPDGERGTADDLVSAR